MNDTTDTRKRTVKRDGSVFLDKQPIGRVVPGFPGYMTADTTGTVNPYMFWVKRSDAVESLVRKFDSTR